MTPDLRIGDVVVSRAGRDKGKYFMVYSIVDGEFVTLVNGSARKQSAPKKKRIKHTKQTGEHLDGIARKLSCSHHVFDAEIRKALEEAGYGKLTGDAKKEG